MTLIKPFITPSMSKCIYEAAASYIKYSTVINAKNASNVQVILFSLNKRYTGMESIKIKRKVANNTSNKYSKDPSTISSAFLALPSTIVL